MVCLLMRPAGSQLRRTGSLTCRSPTREKAETPAVWNGGVCAQPFARHISSKARSYRPLIALKEDKLMRPKPNSLLLGLLLVVLGSVWMFAQTSNDKSKSDTRTITGCLTKEHDSGNSKEYLLTANDGSTWEVRSDSVSLGEHVGHTISATGAVRNATAHNLKEDAKDAAADAHMKKDNNEHGHMTITDVQMVSKSCEK
jgi:hypothetical protein